MSKDMTDAELVEKVAREVLGWDKGPNFFNPLTDANDLQMVKDKLREMGKAQGFEVEIYFFDSGRVCLSLHTVGYNPRRFLSDTEARAICEAAIKATEVEK